ncbi:hypothetical protein NQ176_g9805 [Zarea fungicola]|uniref:Uncharacterized protein n=1 Tax=Zarea fungicola TaxID=93591 RepID=A0ACC1MJG0_9HYPO|nr:hypothetical protein NQ176_g9805 [Lecanicillium fungicola]
MALLQRQSKTSSNQSSVASLESTTSSQGSIWVGPLAYWGTEEIALKDNGMLRIGRDQRANSFAIGQDEENYVSRNHCEVYVILYEPGVSHVYVRDRKSCNGTYVNGVCIGDVHKISSGYLLSDGDVIEIRPYWQFLFKQACSMPTEALSRLQFQESKLFEKQYKILPRLLGAGSQGAVHLALDARTERQLVCKVVNLKQKSTRGQQSSPQNVLQESEILRKLKHPNILTYIDAALSPHTLYIFTELASGGDLLSYINQHESISDFDSRIIVRQIARGLGFLHQHNVVHRDLKPENVLLACSPRLAYHRVMLSDFGSCAIPRSNRLRTNVGTQNFQAPEVLRNERQSNAADIWSLGVISILLISGCGLGGIDSLATMEQNSLCKTVQDILSSCSKASVNGKSFIQDCMKVKPADRITARDAGCHDWFYTPLHHMEFFQQLDSRMAAQ